MTENSYGFPKTWPEHQRFLEALIFKNAKRKSHSLGLYICQKISNVKVSIKFKS